jgi:hypothetical protein
MRKRNRQRHAAAQPKAEHKASTTFARRLRRLHCHWCQGKHVSTACPNRAGNSIKQYGTVVDGLYVPPKGVKVRVLAIPSTVHGSDLTRILKECRS